MTEHSIAGTVRRLATPDRTGAETDRALLDRWLATGDGSAFELVVWRHGAMVLAACRRQLRDPAGAEDAFQAIVLVLVRNSGGIRKAASVASWLHGVAYRTALKARVLAMWDMNKVPGEPVLKPD